MPKHDATSPPPAIPYPDGLRHIRHEGQLVTPAMATALRRDAHFERQRPINSENVRHYASEMERGWFVAGLPIFICTLPNKSMVVINGNHTLEAIKVSGVTVPLVMIYRKVTGIEEAAEIYSNMDIHRMRSWTDALRATKENATGFEGKALAAIGIISGQFRESTHVVSSRNKRLGLLREYEVAVKLLHAALDRVPAVNRRYLTRAAVLAVALVTTKAQPSTAVEFWGGVARDSGLVSNDPRKALLNFLALNPSRQAGMKVQHIAKGTAVAWNAWFEKRPLTIVRPNAMREFRISGTPWHNSDMTDPVDPGPPIELFTDAPLLFGLPTKRFKP